MQKILTIDIPEKRNFGLDLLRFIAILTVLTGHSLTLLPPVFQHIHKVITDGVLIFFVLSGFLIGRILIRDFENGISFQQILGFWKRRWLRTLPTYYFTIAAILLLSAATGKAYHPAEVFKTLFFVQNITAAPESFFIESWSLSIEEWFYFTLPLMLMLLFRYSRLPVRKTVLIAFVFIFLGSAGIRIYYSTIIPVDSIGVWNRYFREPVLTRLDSILLGVSGAWFYRYRKDFFIRYKNSLFIAGCMIFLGNKVYSDYLLTGFGFYSNVVYLTAMPFSVLLMLPFLYAMKAFPYPFLNRFITFTSLTSYSMYLINATLIMGLILNNLPVPAFLRFMLFWILTFLLSPLMYKYIELPFMNLRNRRRPVTPLFFRK